MRMRGLSFAFLLWVLASQNLANAQALIGRKYLVSPKQTATHDEVLRDLRSSGFKVIDTIQEISALVVEPTGTKASANALRRAPSLRLVEPDIEHHEVSLAPTTPNDSLFSMQHWAKTLELERAWALEKGSSNVIVAIPDTGINLKHSDLKNRLWKNSGEIPNNKIDDDGNGLIDDVHGWNFYGKNNDLTDDYEDQGHGTLVAGIIGAEPSNKRGISGINWNVTLMPLKTSGANGKSTTLSQVRSIVYAVKNGARLINASWGTSKRSEHLKAILQWAYQRGTLTIVGAGNDGDNLDRDLYYPSSFRTDSLIAVASMQSPKSLSGFSNWGATTVHLAAPGSSILSTASNGSYEAASGTSFAAPMVTGVAALVLAKAPELTAQALRNALLNAVEFRPTFLERLATSGSISAYKALKQLDDGFQLWPAQLTIRAGDRFSFTAYRSQGNVRWSVSNAAVATIDDKGELHAHTPGVIEITAEDLSGSIAKTRWLRVIAAPQPRKGS